MLEYEVNTMQDLGTKNYNIFNISVGKTQIFDKTL